MIDIKLIREDPKLVKKKIKERGYDVDIDSVASLDKQWREQKVKADSLRSERNKITQEIGKAKSQGIDATELLKKAKETPSKIQEIEQAMSKLEERKNQILHSIPNIQDDSVPVGGEEKNKEIQKWGKIPKGKAKNHAELLEALDLLDMKRGAKVSGSGFYMLKGDLARLERALINFMLDFHIKDGFVEINPPQLVNAKTLFGTGNLPKFEEDVYKTREDLYLIPTAEVPVTNIHANEVLLESELPKKYVAFTQCYRTEGGKHGSETPGIFRLHQFEKVEMVYISNEKESWNYLEEMTERAEKILKLLKLPYRRVLLATGDASFASAKTYDLEVWSPAMKRYLECSSCSNCTDFQARRMNTRYVETKTNERKFAHTLNGSGLATPRLLIALIENNQQANGSIKIPAVLQKYMGGKKKIEAPKPKAKKKVKKKAKKKSK